MFKGFGMDNKMNSNIRHCEERACIRLWQVTKQPYSDIRLLRRLAAPRSSFPESASRKAGIDLLGRNDVYVGLSSLVLLILFCASGCDSKISERVYEQVMIEAPQQDMSMMADPHAGLGLNIDMGAQGQAHQHGLQWDVPKDWSELPASGMRVASFKNAQDPDAIDVSIVSLSGEAGGLEPNLIRWANQIGIDLQEKPDKLQDFIQKAGTLKTRDGSQAMVFDFSQLEDLPPSSKSTVASMLRVGDATVFVKMTGTVKSIAENLESFEFLTQSLREE